MGGRALRQLLDKAEILRDVFNFIKEKNLTGEQTQVLVQSLKSEPRFTIEESFNKCFSTNTKRSPVINDPMEIIIITSEKLTKAINKLVIDRIEKTKNNSLKVKLLTVKNLIEDLLNKL